MLVNVPAGTIDNLLVHHVQTDQLLVVRGSFVLVVLQNRRYQYIPRTERQSTIVKVLPDVPQGRSTQALSRVS